MILVTSVEEYNNKKQKVKLESGFTFCLYKQEVKKYNIRQNDYLPNEIYRDIIDNILLKRCRERAFYILKSSSKTKKQLTDKLNRDMYPMCVIEHTIEFLEKYNYVNDREYTYNYIDVRKKSRSRYMIRNELKLKGISSDIINEVMEELMVDDIMSFEKMATKVSARYNMHDLKERKRFIMMLQRKGYSYDLIGDFLNKVAL